MREERKVFLFAAIVMMMAGAFAFQPIPKEGAKALGVTRGKPFSAGAVFINGKYIEPPYVVERWGTGIRINSIPVTGQVVDWNEFLKTQAGVKIVKKDVMPVKEKESAPAATPVPVATSVPASQPVPVATPSEAPAVNVSALDELFDDDPKSAKSEPEKPAPVKSEPIAKPVSTPVAAPATPKAVATCYVLSGKFRPNDSSKALVGRINSARTEIDRILRSGGFICFGTHYPRVSGDKRTLMAMLDVLPELMQSSESIEAFCSGVHSANLVYFNDALCQELFKNRIDYRKLKERREKFKSDQKWKQILGDSADLVL